ncbi:unnamed protein product [Malus baccata var. baccata]
MKASLQGQVIGIPINSAAAYSFKSADHRAAIQYHHNIPATAPSDATEPSKLIRQSRLHSVLNRMNKLTNKADSFAHGVKEHVRLGPKITETVKGKLRLGAKIVKAGGTLEVFKHAFSVNAGEKLLKASQCYLSTTAGPMAGLLFISTDKIAFCSERSIKLPSSDSDGQQLVSRVHYKVVIPVKKIKAVNQSENRKKPSQKYVEIVTADDFDFWFMGILNYQKTLKYLQQAINIPSQA